MLLFLSTAHPWGSSPLKMATPGPGGDSSSGPSPPWSTHPWTISTLRIVWVINFINIGNAYLIFQDLQPDQLQGSFGCLEPVLYCLTGSLFPRNGQVLSCPETWPHYPHSTPVVSQNNLLMHSYLWRSLFRASISFPENLASLFLKHSGLSRHQPSCYGIVPDWYAICLLQHMTIWPFLGPIQISNPWLSANSYIQPVSQPVVVWPFPRHLQVVQHWHSDNSRILSSRLISVFVQNINPW